MLPLPLLLPLLLLQLLLMATLLRDWAQRPGGSEAIYMHYIRSLGPSLAVRAPLLVAPCDLSGWLHVVSEVDSPACANFQAQDAKTSSGCSAPAIDDNPRTSISWISKLHFPDIKQDIPLGLQTSKYLRSGLRDADNAPDWRRSRCWLYT